MASYNSSVIIGVRKIEQNGDVGPLLRHGVTFRTNGRINVGKIRITPRSKPKRINLSCTTDTKKVCK